MSELDRIYHRMNYETHTMYETVERIQDEKSEVQEFYANKVLFITGATGFMGKCLIEKLLRSCPDLKHIYLLIRPKSNTSIDQRLSKFFQNVIFNVLREMNPSFENKVTAMEGDLSLENLGLSEENQDIIRRNANIIIHNAANVKFYERVNAILKVNVLGTKHMLDLAEKCNNLEAFVYVSSAFSNCYRKRIEEEFYEPPGDLKMVYDMIDADTKTENGLSKDALKMLLGEHFNIYTFTKSMSEELVRQRSEKATFACGVYRPSMVIPTAKEPLAGWVDNINGPVIIFLAAGLGAAHTFYHDRKRLMDVVPCDMSINALLAATWDLSNRRATEQKAVIYNYGSSTVNPITIMGIWDNLKNETVSYRSSNAVWMNFLITTPHFYLFLILHVLFHCIPALLVDLFLLMTMRKPRLVSIVWKISQNLDLLEYFGNGDWRIYMPETMKVINRLNAVDRKLFFCDLRQFDWEEYCLVMWQGVRVYLLKETINSDAGRRRYILLWYLHYGLITALVLTLSYFIMRLII